MAMNLTEFQWDNKYATGILNIDAQHQYLFALTNRLLRNTAENASLPIIAVTLAQLDDYVKEHFDLEEQMLREAGYAELAEHIAQHQSLKKRLHEYGQRLLNESLSPIDFARFMQMWLSKHILQSDMKYLPVVKSCK